MVAIRGSTWMATQNRLRSAACGQYSRAMLGLPTTQGEPLRPLRLGRYEVLGRVAVGGMSEIFLAHEQLQGEPLRRVAIKLLRSPSGAAPVPSGTPRQSCLGRAEALFAREGRTL